MKREKEKEVARLQTKGWGVCNNGGLFLIHLPVNWCNARKAHNRKYSETAFGKTKTCLHAFRLFAQVIYGLDSVWLGTQSFASPLNLYLLHEIGHFQDDVLWQWLQEGNAADTQVQRRPAQISFTVSKELDLMFLGVRAHSEVYWAVLKA